MIAKHPAIVLNWLPPAQADTPSPALSILQRFMMSHNVEVGIHYWNIVLQPALSMFLGKNQWSQLLPFLHIIAEQYGDDRALQRLMATLQYFHPEYLTSKGSLEHQLKKLSKNTLDIINGELDKIPIADVKLIGISRYYFQWVPGMVLAREIKKRNPGIMVLIGGFGDSDSALQMLRTCPDFDFAVWGDGEYPLLQLYRHINGEQIGMDTVPRLFYRSHAGVTASTVSVSERLDFENYQVPAYDDFFEMAKGKIDDAFIRLPVNTARGCPWARCRFCSYRGGHNYQVRSVESILDEIRLMHGKYGIERYIFVDNDIVGPDTANFERLLEGLANLSTKQEVSFQFIGEIIPTGLNAELIRKVILAGFELAHIGYEAVTDGLLQKMNKRNRFADNLLFMKIFTKYKPNGMAGNIITGIPDETEDDVLESINNLHYLRFYLRSANAEMHRESPLNLAKGTPFFNAMPEVEQDKWRDNPIDYLLPRALIDVRERFSLFDYSRANEHDEDWKEFFHINEYYKKNNYQYTLFRNGNVYQYKEFLNNELIIGIIFDKPEYWDILCTANETIQSLESLTEILSKKYPSIDRQRVQKIIAELQNYYLIYSDLDGKQIVTILDTNLAI
jgi:radical SAM superfamily enzyme YgiQ (UPF0313 family)